MNPNIPVFEDSNFFYDLKLELIRDIETLEAEVYSISMKLDSIRMKAEKLNAIAEKHDNQYYKIKLQSLLSQINKIKLKKGYNKIEFDRLYSILSKIKESDRVEFLSKVIKEKIEKIATSQINSSKKEISIPDRENKYYLFNFQRIMYLVKSLPKRILPEVRYSQKNLIYKNNIFPIFPSNPIAFEPNNQTSKLIILRSGFTFFGLRYDFFDTTLEFSKEELNDRLKSIEKPVGPVSNFIKWKGQKCYLINFGIDFL